MRFLADECCDAALVDALRGDGHDVLYAIESLRGATDDDLLSRAVSERCILLTEDKDFLSTPKQGDRSSYGSAQADQAGVLIRLPLTIEPQSA